MKNLYPNFRGSRCGGFTLIELLVVMAIVAVLAALLLPASLHARQRAKNIVCVNQLRQLGLAVRMYAEDSGQHLPAAELLPTVPADPAKPLPRICDTLGSYVGKIAPATNTSVAVFRCPSDDATQFTLKGASYYAQEGSSYEWNSELDGHRIDDTIFQPVKIISTTIVNGTVTAHHEDSKVLLFPPVTTPLLLDYEEFHPRPPKPGKNVVYMDGHATTFEVPPDMPTGAPPTQ